MDGVPHITLTKSKGGIFPIFTAALKQNLLSTFRTFFLLVVTVVAVLSCKDKTPPRPSYTYVVEKGGVVRFTNTSSGVIDHWQWDFDDGSKTTEVSPVHRFTAAGTYNVKLKADNEHGQDTYSEDIEIEAGTQLDFNDHPQFIDANGYFYARNIFEYDPVTPEVYDMVRGSAICALYDSTNFLVSVGRVSVNGQLLDHNSDNSYLRESKDSSWYFTDASLYWSADGGNGYPAMVENVPFDFPEISGITSTEYSRSDSLFLFRLAKSVNFADSVIWIIEYQGETMVEKHTAGDVNGVAFTKDEMSKIVNTGTYTAKVVAFNLYKKIYNFKSVYYTKESYTEADLVVK